MPNKKYNKSGRHEGCARNCVIGQNKVGANEKKNTWIITWKQDLILTFSWLTSSGN